MKQIQHGILLKKINYSESSLILHFFTLEEGFQAGIFQGGKKKKGNILQALNIVEISLSKRVDSELNKIHEVNLIYTPQSIPYHPIKSGLAFFMTEVLAQVLSRSEKDVTLFEFLEKEIQWIDLSDELTNYPLWWMIKLIEKLGLGIQTEEHGDTYFDLLDGTILKYKPNSHQYIQDTTIPLLSELVSLDKNTCMAKVIQKTDRRVLLEHLILYYKTHIQGFKTPHTIQIMQTIFE
ncbi:MAG: DNA repair protein RecO [Brumimicrobium sp.]|nr:DNA repair protein RecO [Brumimicrobium sp.]MCO5267570.1 DNA repair protein RecO [Brumimicrobium sp.]